MKKLTAIYMAMVMLTAIPFRVYAIEVQETEPQIEQNNSRGLDDPVQDLHPGDGYNWTLLFSFVAENVETFLRSDARMSWKRFEKSDLPSTANTMRITGELAHSLNSTDDVIRVGICYFNGFSMQNEPVYYRNIDAGTFDYTFHISEYLTSNTALYYGYVKNLEGQGHIEGTVYIYYH